MNTLYRKLPIILVLISSSFYYLAGYFFFPDTFQQIFFPNNHIWDETIFYIYPNHSVIPLNSYSFFPEIFKAFLFLFIPVEYFPIFLNLIVTGLLLIVLSLIGRGIFHFDRVYNIVFITMFSTTLGWGITTYSSWLEIISISTVSDPLVYRQDSPGLVIALFLFGLYLIYYGMEKKRVIVQTLGLALSMFSYPFYTVFIVICLGALFLVNFRFFKLKRLKFLFLFFILFTLFWFYMSPEVINDNYKFINGLTYTADLNYKILLMNSLFVLFGIYFYQISKAPRERLIICFLLLGIFSGVVAHHLNIILGYEIQSYHWDMYLLRPLQWTLVLYVLYMRIFRYRHKEKVFLFTWVFSVLFSITVYVSAKNMYIKNYKPLERQLSLIKSYQALSLYISNGEHYTTLDPLLILMSRHLLPNAILDMPFSGHQKKVDSKKILESFIRSIHAHNLKINKVNEIFNSSFESYLNRDKVFNYILFGMDFNDGIYHSLSEYDREINVKNIDTYMNNQYLSGDQSLYKNSIVINKWQFNKEQIQNILQDRFIEYEDDNMAVISLYNESFNGFLYE